MASDPSASAPPSVPPQAPLAGTRAQAVQRLQVGLFGLGAMVLLVGLANVIMTNARQHQSQTVAASAANTARSSASDPLADAGVVPDMPAAAQSSESAGQSAPQPVR